MDAFYFDIPRNRPQSRLRRHPAGLNGVSPDEILAAPDDVYILLGLHEALTPQRLRGLHALMGYMKRQVRNLR